MRLALIIDAAAAATDALVHTWKPQQIFRELVSVFTCKLDFISLFQVFAFSFADFPDILRSLFRRLVVTG